MAFNSPKTVAERKLLKCLYRLGAKIDPKIKFVVDEYEETSARTFLKTVYINPFDVFNIMEDEDILLQVTKEKGFHFDDILMPTFLILHEIGHIIEVGQFINYRAIQKQYFRQVDNLLKIDYDKLTQMRIYKGFKVEHLADKIAYDLYVKYYCHVKQFDKEVREILRSL